MKKKGPTTLGYALLGLIRQRAQTGYDLRKVFQSTPMGHYSSSPGALYPALERLEQQGLVEGVVDDSRPLRPKRQFRATRAGERVLEEWLSAPVRREDVIWRQDELMLRFAFMAFVPRTTTLRFLEELTREVQGHVAELRRHLRALPPRTPAQGRLALESGIDLYQALGRWARRASKELGS